MATKPSPLFDPRPATDRKYPHYAPGRTSANVDALLKHIEALAKPTDDEPPSAGALQRARNLVTDVSAWTSLVPDPVAVFSIDGGVEIAWREDNRHLRLFCAASSPEKAFIYKSMVEDREITFSSVTHDVNIFTLAEGLRWLQPNR